MPECPVSAIVAEDDLTPEQLPYRALNAEVAAAWPAITQAREPLADAEHWAGVTGKHGELQTGAA